MSIIKSLFIVTCFIACNTAFAANAVDIVQHTNAINQSTDTIPATRKHVTRQEIVSYAKTLVGSPYKYGCSDPSKGFDCSGFISYVFDQFDVQVPRSSVDFTDVGREVTVKTARPGDLILFTGTNNKIRKVGHIGIVVENNNGALQFIHASSGKVYGVVVTPLNDYYQGRFMKIIDVFPVGM